MDREPNVELLRDLCDTMLGGSLCALGGMAPFPVLSALDHFPEDFNRAPRTQSGQPPRTVKIHAKEHAQ